MSEDWAERIPAAIAKAEAELAGAEWRLFDIEEKCIIITRGQVALAKARWAAHHARWGATSVWEADCDACVALRAFVEKVEAL